VGRKCRRGARGVAVSSLRGVVVSSVRSWVRRATSFGRSSSPGLAESSPADAPEQPLRSELLSVDQLARHAAALAVSHQLARTRGPDQLIARLDENERILLQTYQLVATAAARGRR